MENRAVNTPERERTNTLSERELLALQASRGDRNALQGLCEKVSKKVLVAVRSLMSGSADVEDVGQNVLIRLCEKIGGLQEPKAFDAWLNRIIINETRMHQRQQARQPWLYVFDGEDEDIEEDNIDYLPQEMAMRKEEARILFSTVSALPGRQKEAVMLHYYRHMSAGETADIMGIDVDTVYQLLGSARKKIKRELLQQGEATKSARLHAFAFLPLGPLVAKAFSMEEQALNIDTDALVHKAMGGERPGRAAVVTRKAAGGIGFLRAAGLAALGVLAAAAILLAAQPRSEPQGDAASANEVQGSITFSGGSELQEHVNPTAASASARDMGGEMDVVRWKITPAESGEVLYSGEGDTPDEALADLVREGRDGQYTLHIYVRDSGSHDAWLTREFTVQTG